MTRPGPGKFEGNESEEIAEALYRITLDGGQEADAGSVETGSWFGLVVFDPKGSEASPAWTEPEAENVVAYIVSEDDQGFFSYSAFEDESEARDAWAEIESDHAFGGLGSDE